MLFDFARTFESRRKIANVFRRDDTGVEIPRNYGRINYCINILWRGSGANVNYVTRLIVLRFNSLLMRAHYACTMRTLIINANGVCCVCYYCFSSFRNTG